MNIVVIAYDCNPYEGSESWIGWNFIKQEIKFNRLIVVTSKANKPDIEDYIKKNPSEDVCRVKFAFVNENKYIKKYKLGLTEQFCVLETYMLWLNSAYKEIKKNILQERVDVIHHLTLQDFRVMGKVWKLDVPLILGPLGGGQETPKCLKRYITEKKTEIIRSCINNSVIRSRNYKMALEKASFIFSANDETTEVMSKTGIDSNKIIQLSDLSVEEKYLYDRLGIKKQATDKTIIIVSGRLIGRKGISLLIDAISKVNTDNEFVVRIFGNGPEKDNLAKQIEILGLKDKVFLMGNVSLEKIQKEYKRADIYILPSLRETTGTAVFEAAANKLPIIALNQNGVKHIVQDDAGILIDVCNEEQVIIDMAKAITKLIEDKSLREKYGENAFNKMMNKYTWEKRASYFDSVYRKVSESYKYESTNK